MENFKMIKLSFIVPVYNVEQYLRKCIDSLLAQDIPSSEYEIILVDDGSPDKCPQICDEYAAAHKNVQVIHQKNGGLSAARNTGIEVAKGGYICFVDSDDFWEENALGGIMLQIEREQLDVLRFDYQNVRIGVDGQYEVFYPYKNHHTVDRREDVVDGIAYLNERMGYNCYAIQFIVRREIAPLFADGIHFEDVDWLPRMMLKAKKVKGTSKIVYNYCAREGSITQEKDDVTKRHRNVNDALIVIERLKPLYDSNPNCYWIYNMVSFTTMAILNTVSRYFYKQRTDYIKKLQKIGVFPLSVDDIGGSYMFKARLCNFSPYVGITYLHIINILLKKVKK